MNSIDTYIIHAPANQQAALTKLQVILRDTLIPLGYEECMSYGMIGYVVPFSLYPSGYHCDASLPLPFINLASRKSGIRLYHMGITAHPGILKWWQEEYEKCHIGKLDMGTSCIRFKNIEKIPYSLIQVLVSKIRATEWIQLYEQSQKKL